MKGGMVLVVNAGSSSLKVELYTNEATLGSMRSVSVEGIGTQEATLLPEQAYGSEETKSVQAPTHTAAAELVQAWLEEVEPEAAMAAVGYRVVHGGSEFIEPTVINERVVEQLHALTNLAPNHMPAVLQCMEVFRMRHANALHVACFDTAFFARAPEIAKLLPIPHRLGESGVRRYGFHGLSYEYLLDSFRSHEGEMAARGRVVLLHLGSGASMAASRGGRPVDMSMGFTPVSGITMSTRTGDIEPGVLLHLLRDRGMSIEEVEQLVTYESGLKGISGVTGDMYQLLQAQADNQQAALAVEYFCRTIKKQLGAYAALLGGVDSIIFAGGIGERSSEIRTRILEGLEFIGVKVDNKRNSNSERLISHDLSRVGVHVIPTHEGRMVAQQTVAIYNNREG